MPKEWLGSWSRHPRGGWARKAWLGVCGSRPGVSEDSDDSKVSLWLEQWLAQSWDSDNICWHEWDKGEKKKKKEWLGKWRNYLLFNKVRWMAYWLSISYRIDQWNPPSGMTLHVALACLSSQIFPLPASYFVLSPDMLPGFTLISRVWLLAFTHLVLPLLK